MRPISTRDHAFTWPRAGRWTFIILVMCCVGACQVQTGATTLSDSTMVLVLADLHVLDAGYYLEARDSNWTATDDGTPLFETGATRDSIFQVHGVTSAQFDATVQQLVEDPDRFLAIYEDVLDRLSVRASR